ncbi:unnamed protein product [Caenorhabditis auriculariae]|uniref:Branched-chain-amino-acid aminotransferase n=1 Tax=Caenorhabditis auriculariae TaxID=2777116 RepID=A0A8S1HG86_9PELO|nr:unnamed protein product [Caenorhabditis auriculariae]
MSFPVLPLESDHAANELSKKPHSHLTTAWISTDIRKHKMPALLSSMASRAAFVTPRFLATVAPTEPKSKPAQDPMKSFYRKDLKIQKATKEQMHTKPDHLQVEKVKFGHTYADHMMTCDWDETNGWAAPKIEPITDLKIHPGAKVLHYASELFEGMKAYRGLDNKIRLFRPEMNMARMRRTAARAALPDFDAEEAVQILIEMLKIDQEWVPYSNVCSLYIRPTLIGTDPTLGVAFSKNAKFFVITGPAGQYYATGFQPVKLLADSRHIRAFPGGVGAYKMGCNYAPTIWVGKEAEKKNCQQVLWLNGEDEEITEVGTMNIFVLWKNEQGELELVTPPLHKGLILPGVTRDSLLELAREMNEFKVSERIFYMEDVKKALAENRLFEMFGCGTACVVNPVGSIHYHNKEKNEYEDWNIPTMKSKYNVMQRFYDTIVDIQYGRLERPGWTREI